MKSPGPESFAGKVPLPLKAFGALCLVGGIATVPIAAIFVYAYVHAFRQGEFAEDSVATIIVGILFALTLIASLVLFIVLGLRLLRGRRRRAAQAGEALIILTIANMVFMVMLFGIAAASGFFAVVFAVLVALVSYLDPALAQERRLQRKLRNMEARDKAEEGTLGRDETGKGYIALDFFNLFWIFVVCSVLGLIIETVHHMLIVDFGVYQNRTGMLFGPFSPIYGFGAVLMTIALNRFYKAPIIVVFVVSAAIGGAFEYAVSWFLEIAFGVVAWDYTGYWLSIDGRTCGIFMIAWGVLGLVWIRVLLPRVLKLVNLIPWKFRYTLTTICAVLMIVNGVMTLQSLECWYERVSGNEPVSAIDVFYAENFDDEFMANRFQTMTITPGAAARG